METAEVLEKMKEKAGKQPALRDRILETQEVKDPLSSFCAICREEGFEISPMEILEAGEYSYAAMRRSTNGGGENSPLLAYEDDLYEMFLQELKQL